GSRFCGSLNTPLTPRGWRQMLAAVVDDGPWDAIVSSPRSRCVDFAQALARRHTIPLTRDDCLREMDFGAWEGCSAAEIMAREPEALAGFWNDPIGHSPPGAEPLTRFQARTLAAWEEVLDRYRKQRILLVTHGGVIRVILCHLLERPLSHALRMEVAHASVHRVRVPHPTAGGSAELLTALVPC
ncbi:MAG: histidine phosphatase family protein, partial [Gammaproteobacteria bacterium]